MAAASGVENRKRCRAFALGKCRCTKDIGYSDDLKMSQSSLGKAEKTVPDAGKTN